MSKDAAISFAERLKTDDAFQARLSGAADSSERLAILQAEGFDLSKDDVAAVKQALGIEELSDEDLERVAGGAGETTVATISAGYWSASVAVAAAAL